MRDREKHMEDRTDDRSYESAGMISVKQGLDRKLVTTEKTGAKKELLLVFLAAVISSLPLDMERHELEVGLV